MLSTRILAAVLLSIGTASTSVIPTTVQPPPIQATPAQPPVQPTPAQVAPVQSPPAQPAPPVPVQPAPAPPAPAGPAKDQPVNLPFFVYNHNALLRTRLDPIVNPGKISAHMHVFSGANRITADGNFASISTADCTTSPLSIDKSLYWAPQLYYKDEQGKYTAMSGEGHVTYWFYHRGEGDAESFPELPDDFRMVAGNMKRNSIDMTRPADQAVSFQCFKGGAPGQPNVYDMRLPYIPADFECETIRPQIGFPNCWDGVNSYKKDGSHVVYGEGEYQYGKCPPGFKRIPTLFLESYYKPAAMIIKRYNWRPGCLVFAHGDNFGLTFHADWMNGFPKGVLNQAFDQCKNVFDGTAKSCPYLAKYIQTEEARNACNVGGHLINEAVGIDTPLARLPGNNPEYNSSLIANKPKVPLQPYTDMGKIVNIDPAQGGICKSNQCTDFKGTGAGAGAEVVMNPPAGGAAPTPSTKGGKAPVVVTIYETIYATGSKPAIGAKPTDQAIDLDTDTDTAPGVGSTGPPLITAVDPRPALTTPIGTPPTGKASPPSPPPPPPPQDIPPPPKVTPTPNKATLVAGIATASIAADIPNIATPQTSVPCATPTLPAVGAGVQTPPLPSLTGVSTTVYFPPEPTDPVTSDSRQTTPPTVEPVLTTPAIIDPPILTPTSIQTPSKIKTVAGIATQSVQAGQLGPVGRRRLCRACGGGMGRGWCQTRALSRIV